MHAKEIKRLVLMALKRDCNYRRLTKKEKKAASKVALEEVMKTYSFKNKVATPIHELTATPDIEHVTDVMPIHEMISLINDINAKIIRLPIKYKSLHLKDKELIEIDKLLNNDIINLLLAKENLTPRKRNIYPCHYVRAELLKAIKFSEIAYRKFCPSQLNDIEQKANRAFVGLPLNKRLYVTHSQLSTFRSSLSFADTCNLMIYIICLFMGSGTLDNPFKIYGIDSTDLAVPCDPYALLKVELPGGQKLRIYSDLDADVGTRRNKRNKSKYFVGYRLHTITAVNHATGKSCPIISLVAPGNHHDSLFLTQIISLAKAIGLDVDIMLGDEDYGDGPDSEEIRRTTGVKVVTPPRSVVASPANVDPESKAVFLDGYCEIPMQYMGKTEEGLHEFKCNAEPGACSRCESCPQFREVPVDAGLFGQIPEQVTQVEELRGLRKNVERAFNLLKNREGLETLRTRSQQGVTVQATFANMANLLIEIVGTRRTVKKNDTQFHLELKEAA